MNEIIELQEKLAQDYKYEKLPKKLSSEVRLKYKWGLQKELDIYGNSKTELLTSKSTHLSNGYERVVIGDYGAFIEMSDVQISRCLITQPGQEFRLDKKYNVKYQWLTVKDGSEIKVYYQLREVSYADYKPGMYYVSPYEIILKGSSNGV